MTRNDTYQDRQCQQKKVNAAFKGTPQFDDICQQLLLFLLCPWYVNPISTGGELFLAPTRVNPLAFFCERENCFQMLMSFLFEDFNTSK